MGKIVAKLDLNKNPQNVEPNSLIYAKNIRLGRDGNLYPDFPFKNVSDVIVNLLIEENLVDTHINLSTRKWYAEGTSEVIGAIVGINNTVYLFVKTYNPKTKVTKHVIIEYNETFNTAKRIKCAWTYSGGTIDGYASTNHTGEIILTICERLNTTVKIPMKHINLSQCSDDDDESLYTQAPNIPITNLFLVDTYPKTIPNGVYQFFIRYEIRKNFYTNWFPCSKECFAGNSTKQDTVQGTVKYVNLHRDASTSFIFSVEHINEQYKANYKRFQLGFILSHDDEVVARSWKHFDIESTTNIYFDYDKSSIEEIDVTDLLYDTYELYNVGNIDYFKNKLYISNYSESDKNPKGYTISNENDVESGDLVNLAKRINVNLIQKELETDAFYIDGKALSGLVNDNVYTLWGSNKIKDLFLTKKYNLISTVDDTKAAQTRSIVYSIYAECNWSVNPELYFAKDIAVNREDTRANTKLNLPEAHYHFYWPSNGVFNVTYVGYTHYIVRDAKTHVLSNTNAFKDGYFFIKFDSASNPSFGEGDTFNTCQGIGSLKNEFKSKVEALMEEKAPKFQIRSIKLIGSEGYTKTIYDSGDVITYYKYEGYDIKENDIESYVLNEVSNHIVGIVVNDNDAYYVVKDGSNYVNLTDVQVELAEYTYDCEVVNHDVSEELTADDFQVFATKHTSVRHLKLNVDSAYVSNTVNKTVQYNTLMPFTQYKFYAHYIDKKGIITNGYEIGTYSMDSFNHNISKSIIYPVFSNVIVPDEFSACFISVSKPKETVCEGFDFSFIPDSGTSQTGTLKINCLEADALLYPLDNNIKIITANGTDVTNKKLGTYYPSGTVAQSNFNSFGSAGFIGVSGVKRSDIAQTVKSPVTIQAKMSPGIANSAVKYFQLKLVCITNSVRKTLSYVLDNGVEGVLPGTESFYDYADKGIIFKANVNIVGPTYGYVDISINILENAYIKDGSDNNVLINSFYSSVIAKAASNDNYFIYYYSISNAAYKIATYRSNLEDAKSYESNNYGTQIITRQDITLDPSNDIPHFFWIKISDNNNEDYNSLIKLTPYISKQLLDDADNTYDNYETLNSPSYLCNIYKPQMEQDNYVSGTDVYRKDFSGNDLKLDDINGYVPVTPTNRHSIYSTYNLNYLSMSEDFVPSIRRYSQNEGGTGAKKQVFPALNSLTLSDCYKLESMYKDYVRKYFFIVDNNTITNFENTIRSSKAIADEVFNNIYEFLAEDYYNVPANRGKIVNLIAVANNIYVHTEHALYRFTGNNSLVGNESDVVTKETDVFDSGITEIFDSEIGYAGLQHKNESIVTFNAYIFYDRLANTIYAYEGQSGLTNISANITKLLDYLISKSNNNLSVEFASDYKADRIFVNFYYPKEETEINSNNKVDKDTQIVVDIPDAGSVIGEYEEGLTKDGNVSFDNTMPENGSVGPAADESGDDPAMNDRYNVCLSYDLKTKSFISIHDFDFEGSISTRSNTYFTRNISGGTLAAFTKVEIPGTNPKQYINKIEAVGYGFIFEKINHHSYINSDGYVLNELNNNDYDKFYKKSLLSCADENAPTQTYYKRGVSCIDVICNINYEQVKCINYINWICSKVLNLGTKNSPEYVNADNINFAEENIGENNERYPGNFLRIYSDTCHTDIIDINNIQNNEHYYKDAKERTGLNPNSYKYVRYNKGIWAYDYFRDIKNSNSSVKSDDMSLIYGKYFVVRFVFYNKNYKFENVKINMNNYD